jgi:pimeloyl-ACP methyl ester carboxylesterase
VDDPPDGVVAHDNRISELIPRRRVHRARDELCLHPGADALTTLCHRATALLADPAFPDTRTMTRVDVPPDDATTDGLPPRRGQPDTWRVDVESLAFRVLASRRDSARRPAIVLVHGIGVSHRYLSRLHDVFAQERDVYSIDLPGFAGLPKPGRDVDVPSMADALGSLIESMKVGPVVLVGHSMGTQWVVEASLQRPAMATDVVIMGPVADASHRSMVAQSVALAADTLGETPSVNAIVLTDYLRCGVPWYLMQLRHMLEYRLEDRVPELSVPLLVVRGSRDPIAGLEWCRRLRDAARIGQLVQIPGGFHVAQHSAPKAVASAIRAHVRQDP